MLRKAATVGSGSGKPRDERRRKKAVLILTLSAIKHIISIVSYDALVLGIKYTIEAYGIQHFSV